MIPGLRFRGLNHIALANPNAASAPSGGDLRDLIEYQEGVAVGRGNGFEGVVGRAPRQRVATGPPPQTEPATSASIVSL
jgi:hypothetical protein